MLNNQIKSKIYQSSIIPNPNLETVAVLGLGYVGWPVATAYAEAGFHVIGIDVDTHRIDLLRGDPLAPPPCAPLSGRLLLTSEMTALGIADVVFICVPTPLEEGEARHEAVRACASAFAQHGRPDALVILESTVRPGFVDALRPLLGHGGSVALAYAPERIDPQPDQGCWRLRDIPRLVAGVDETARTRALAVLRLIGVAAHPVALRVAEYAKLLENSYRLLNIAFIDQFAALCRAEGIDPHAVVNAAATKPYGYHPFWPGVGAGGHCIAVDPAFLAHQGRSFGTPLTLLEGALDANVYRPRAVAANVAAQTGPDETILVVGLTYKPGVPDLRESAALIAARTLSSMNRRVLAFDPLVEPPNDLEAANLADALTRATSAVLLVPQTTPVMEALMASGLHLFDATGTLIGAVGV